MADRAGAGRDREQHARDERDARRRRAELADVERQHRPEAAIDELEAEDHDRHQQEVLEREHVAERHRPAPLRRRPPACACARPARRRARTRARARRSRTPRRRRTRGAARRAPRPMPPKTGPERRAEPLRRLHRADRLRHASLRRRVRRHRQRQRAVAGEQPLDDAQREHVPRARHERHRRHDDDEAARASARP